MVRHKTIRPYLHFESSAPFGHKINIELIVILAEEGLHSAIASLGEVMGSPGDHDASDSSHGCKILIYRIDVKQLSMVSQKLCPQNYAKAAGYSLRELGAEVGISHRMLVYYEKHSEHPPAHLLPQLAKALGVSADQLLGMEKVKDNGRRRDSRLWRRISQVEKLPTQQRKQIVQIIDAFLEREKLKKAS